MMSDLFVLEEER